MAISRDVFIYGDRYRLKTEHDPELVQRIATFVERKMKDIEQGSSVLTTSKVAVMAAFHIAADYLLLQEEVASGKQRLNELHERLVKVSERIR